MAHFLPLRLAARRPSFRPRGRPYCDIVRPAKLDTRSGLHLLVQRFDLTPREAEVLQAIAEVRGPSQVAALLGISTRTAKAHLHSVYEKTGTDRQADLIKLVAGFSAQP